jgi:uncharacterized protein YaaR (DUF327 family)
MTRKPNEKKIAYLEKNRKLDDTINCMCGIKNNNLLIALSKTDTVQEHEMFKNLIRTFLLVVINLML